MALANKDLQAIQTLLLPINDRLDQMDSRFEKMDDRLNKIDIQLDKLDSEVSSLESGQIEIRKDLKNIDRRVLDTYNLALDSWEASTENRVWLESINSNKSGRKRSKKRNIITSHTK